MTRSFNRSIRNLQDMLALYSGTTYLNLSGFGRQVAKRRWSEIWPPCISVQGHLGSNPSNASDRHLWVSYWHSMQTLAVSRTVWEIIAVKVGLFWRSIEPSDWETQTVLNCRKYIFWKEWHPRCHRRKEFFQKSLTVSSQRAKTWRRSRKFDRFFDVFWPLWPGFWTYQNSLYSV